MVAVCFINGIQCFYCAQTLFDEQEDTDIALLLLGDAVQSFLGEPDEITQKCPLLIRAEVDAETKNRIRFNVKDRPSSVQWLEPQSPRWYHAVGHRDFVLTLSL